MSTPYWKMLQHPKWQARRLEVLKMAGFTCENCAETESQLHVHHRYYERGKKPWEYPDNALSVLCENCHERAGRREATFSRAVAEVWWHSDSLLMGFVAALAYESAPPYADTIVFDRDFCPGAFAQGVSVYWGVSAEFVYQLICDNNGVIPVAAIMAAGGTSPGDRDGGNVRHA